MENILKFSDIENGDITDGSLNHLNERQMMVLHQIGHILDCEPNFKQGYMFYRAKDVLVYYLLRCDLEPDMMISHIDSVNRTMMWNKLINDVCVFYFYMLYRKGTNMDDIIRRLHNKSLIHMDDKNSIADFTSKISPKIKVDVLLSISAYQSRLI